jgi:transcription termination factor NusB
MNKRSYTSSVPEKQISSKKTKVSATPALNESGARGTIFPGTYKDTPFLKQNEDYIDDEFIDKKNTDNKIYSDLKDLIIDLADQQDQCGDFVFSNFNDFLLKKIAQSEKTDYSHSFNLLIKVINNSDILDKDVKIAKLVRLYNRLIKVYVSKHGIDGAKLKAYQAVRNEVESHVNSNLIKNAQMIENDPVYVSQQLSNIIDIMLNKISKEKRPGSYDAVVRKLKQFNTMEISSKKNPGGAAIGVSLGLVKNILNGKNPYYINIVLQELMKRLQ